MIKRFLLTLLLLIAPALVAAQSYVAKSGSTSVRVTAQPCANDKVRAVIAAVEPSALEDFRGAHVILAGRTLAACWMQVSEDELIVVLEDGRAQRIPLAVFRSEPRL